MVVERGFRVRNRMREPGPWGRVVTSSPTRHRAGSPAGVAIAGPVSGSAVGVGRGAVIALLIAGVSDRYGP
jgi:hypothetical protein